MSPRLADKHDNGVKAQDICWLLGTLFHITSATSAHRWTEKAALILNVPSHARQLCMHPPWMYSSLFVYLELILLIYLRNINILIWGLQTWRRLFISRVVHWEWVPLFLCITRSAPHSRVFAAPQFRRHSADASVRVVQKPQIWGQLLLCPFTLLPDHNWRSTWANFRSNCTNWL